MLKLGLLSIFLTINFFSGQLQGACQLDPDYIVYVRPGGALGNQLQKFWTSVKKQNLNDPVVLKYPPHCTLTGFFPGTRAQEKEYIAALRKAIEGTNPIVINLANSVNQKPKLDYIPLTSSDLFAITTEFANLIDLPSKYIKAKPGTFGYHISLRQDTDAATTAAVRKLEDKYINLKAPKLSEKTTWAIYLYRKSGDLLEEIVKIPI